MQLQRRNVDMWMHVGIFSLYLGALSVFGVTRRMDPTLGSMAQLGLLMLTWTLVLYAIWRSKRVPLMGILLLGLLPYLHMAYFTLSGEPTGGAFSYLYKMSGFLLAPYLWLWARSRDDAQIERVLTVLALFIAARAVLTFVVPSLGVTSQAFADDFIIYEWVGPLPRVFYPGLPIVFFGLLVSIRNVFVATSRQVPLEVFKALLCAAALAVSLSRGMLIFAVLVATLLVLIKFTSTRVANGRKGRTVLGSMLALNAGALLFLATPLADTAGQAIGNFAGEERFSLDSKNLDWRAQQVRVAFLQVQTDEERFLGVGTTSFIPESIENRDPRLVTNELHYSYDSIRWTFGYLGLFLLIVFTLVQPVVRAAIVRPPSSLLLPFLLAAVFIGLVGSYTIVFTTADWSFTLCLCGAFLNARCAHMRAPAHAGLPGSALFLPVSPTFSKGLLDD